MQLDVLVLGSGVAGLSAVVRLTEVPGMRVGVLTKGDLAASATLWAQGGVAAVLGGDEDSTDLHLADTLAAGAGLCDADAVRVLVDEGPARVRELIALGAVFDREAGGALALAREGGHSTARVLHAGGAATGCRGRAGAGRRGAPERGRRARALVRPRPAGGGRPLCGCGRPRPRRARAQEVRARHVVLATGGAGQLFSVTTNPLEATGDGTAMALRAGVPVADIEFFQFHPTALHHPAMPRPLLSEALRGHGALLRDAGGERFVDELAPRDVVSRAMADAHGRPSTSTTCGSTPPGSRPSTSGSPRSPRRCVAAGLDPAESWLPIAPAAHHLSGGVLTDLDGASALPGLWAAGECACTGVHGANRLASNSLLEGMVFGARLAEAIEDGRDGPRAHGRDARACSTRSAGHRLPRRRGPRPRRGPSSPAPDRAARDVATHAGRGDDLAKARDRLQRAMTEGAGVLRSAESLERAARRGRVGAGVRRAGFAAAASPGRAGRRASWPTWPTLSSGPVGAPPTRGPRPAAPMPAGSSPSPDPAWRRRLVHGDGAAVTDPGLARRRLAVVGAAGPADGAPCARR